MARSRLILRLAIAVVGAACIILITYLGLWALGVGMLLVGLVTQGEVYRLYKLCGRKAWYTAGLTLGALLGMRSLNPHTLHSVLLVAIFLLGWASIRRPQDVFDKLWVTLLGAIYPTAMLAFVMDIRHHAAHLGSEHAVNLTLTVLILIWATDTCAYVVGSAIGRYDLAPTISPNKTIEGVVGGLIGALLAGVVLEVTLVPFVGTVKVLVLALLCGLSTQAGDLYASHLKRRARVKDSGYILPGHGGMLDRFDGAIFASPVAYFYLLAIGELSRA